MKNIKKIFAVIMVVCLCLTVVGCHKKNETAVKVGSLKFTSGYYACVLFFTDSSARSKVETQLEEDGKSTDDINYYKQKIDGKSYVDWVKEETINTIKRIAASKLYCKENKLKLGDDAEQMKSYAEYYWENGYSDVLIKNGVGNDSRFSNCRPSYINYMTDLSYENLYFNDIFGAEGKKAISEETLKEELSKNYAIADMLDVSFDELTDEEKTQKTEQLEGYMQELKKGTRTFEEIYHEYNGEEHEDEEAGDGSDKPLDSHATFIGSADTDYANDYFDEIKTMENGEVKIIDKADNAGKILVVKGDVIADPYYLSNYDLMLRHAIADEDFDKLIEEYIKDLDVKEYKSAINNFKVKKIYYPETNQQ